MSPNDADGMANSVDPDQTAPLFAQAYLSENLGSLGKFLILKFYTCSLLIQKHIHLKLCYTWLEFKFVF